MNNNQRLFIKNLKTCHICYEEFKEPKRFVSEKIFRNWYLEPKDYYGPKEPSCRHIFCKDCYKGWFLTCYKNGNSIRCPDCRFEMMSFYRMVWYYNITKAASVSQ